MLEASAEVFNLFNRATYSYVLNQAAQNYGQRSSANSPRQVQLGVRYSF